MGGLAVAGRFRVRGVAPAGATTTAAASSSDSSVSAQAFGAGSSGPPPSGKSALSPLDAFGQTHWVAVGTAAFLIWLYWTLPD